MGYLAVVIAATMSGFMAGLLSFKVKSRWCASCGAVKCCPRCAGWARSGGPRALLRTPRQATGCRCQESRYVGGECRVRRERQFVARNR
jgi:hypothetical protein